MSNKNPLSRAELEELARRERARQAHHHCRLFCCTSTPCLSSGSAEILDTLQHSLKAGHLDKKVQLVSTGCMGLCSQGPLVRIQIEGQQDILYGNVNSDVAREIVSEYLIHDNPAQEQMLPHDIPHFRASFRRARDRDLTKHVLPPDMPFFNRQVKVALANAGLIDPEKLGDYLAQGGYSTLAKVLHEWPPEQVCEEIVRSGLRGRGGAGYPTGLKWQHVRQAAGDKKYVVANGDEGDPGAYMDRTLMEADPHRVLEGMAIAGYAVGAQQGYLYVRGEYPVAVQLLEKAIRAAERQGILGKQVLDSNFSFHLEVRVGAGAFVCGEETALIHSIEGLRGVPRMRPPYPAQSGLWGCPTLINNVETLANIVPIVNKGANWFAGIGTEKSKGTKVFALTGKLQHTGLIEVPMGITLGEIVNEMGGGVPQGRTFKAAQTGGPSGGCIPASHLDVPIDYESLRELGSIMGSGGLVVIDDESSMPDVARFFMEFCMDESCGKCVPCRVGTVKMYRLLERLTAGQATQADLNKLEELCRLVQKTSMCGLGQTAPNPVLSTLRYFRHEYEALLKNDSSDNIGTEAKA